MKEEENIDNALGVLLGEICRLHHSKFHSMFAKIGLHRGQHRILFILWRKDGVTQKEISEELSLAPATITDALQRMEKIGLIERKNDSEDQRVTRVYLTENGKQFQVEVDKTFKNMEEDIFKDFIIEEKVILRRLFIQVRDNLKYI